MNNVISERIKILIKQKNTSAKLVLEELNLNPGFITDINRKGVSPTADKIVRIADYFDVSTDYLLGRTDNPKVNE